MLNKLFGFNKKDRQREEHNSEEKFDFSKVGVDIHSHLIPGIDDGAQTIEDSLGMIEKLMQMGFTSAITTPHIKYDHYPNSTEIITKGLRTLHQALKEHNIDFPVKAAAEYYIDDHFMQLLAEKQLMTISDNKVLVELSFLFEPVRFYDLLFKIQTAGYKPILAHPERYNFYHQKLTAFKELKDRGCLLQLNTMSLTSYYGSSVKKTAEYILENDLYDYCGTDAHHLKHLETLEAGLKSGKLNKLNGHTFLNSSLSV